ncbi:hypothetical protein [Persicitalea sp.]|uniref:hypothetical protein n=1 Tax=Persicitalea sp. TaxID=3100273 RepID=UPI00359447ED
MKLLHVVLFGVASIILALIVSQYFFCPRFHFEEQSPFEGPILYNPYKDLNPSPWVKCNFHAHARAWNGVTSGKGNAADIHRAYRSLNYGVHCVSNYHEIDSTDSDEKAFIAAYEHGYNPSKTHQLVLGSRRVLWLDYLLPQTVHNKQYVLSRLRTPGSITVLNHPEIRRGYTGEDLDRLMAYDCMEVLNPAATSTREWDAALSAGKKVFIIGNDDIHNVMEPTQLGKNCTFVNVSHTEGSQVLEALRVGRSYGVVIGDGQPVDSIPALESLSVQGQTVTVKMDQEAELIEVTGQHGKRLALHQHTNYIAFELRKSDHYARTTVRYNNGTTLYLNPVFFIPSEGYVEGVFYEDWQGTILYRALGTLICCLWILLLLQLLTGYRLRLPPLPGRILSR